ncbi:MAG: GNAT family N-acetyltransferase [Candidatus Accumulibacter meliphilus]|jgi:GNAT superfamily N-acetyltransferase|uniref:GNAT family N-acetyltransferase n=1 Tax=Candidatus Accumulibacter meliphilus TaxID=2211374 RepID=UPI002FC29899
MDATSIIDPTKSQLETVIRWLKKEHLNELHGSSGFYCNRSIIRKPYRHSQMKCLMTGHLIVGFAIFSLDTTYSAIDILEIRPAYRGNGYGRLFATQMINFLFSGGAPYVAVECSPITSEPFWRNLGFVDEEKKYSSWENPKLILRPKEDERGQGRFVMRNCLVL